MVIPNEQLSAKREEIRVKKTIVLKNDTVLNILEKPIDSRRDGRVTTHVVVKKPCFDIAGPVNGCCCLPGQAAPLSIFRTVAAGAVSCDEKPFRLDLPQILHDRSRLNRSVEDDQKDWDLFVREGGI